jgi:hypothetical protein
VIVCLLLTKEIKTRELKMIIKKIIKNLKRSWDNKRFS